MIRCSHCNAQQFDGTIFCSECGATLVSSGPRRETTAALNKASDADGPPLTDEAGPAVVPAPAGPGGPTISLVVINSGRRMVLDAGEDVVIGRKDNQRGIYPDVDLGLDGGYDAGVSRRHAVIARQAGGYTLEDLSSANGTFINGHRLGPDTPTPIRHGDELTFGTLILRFEIG